jgi:hypothetical protein
MAVARRYFSGFILLVDDGHGRDDPLHLVVGNEMLGGVIAEGGEDMIHKSIAIFFTLYI